MACAQEGQLAWFRQLGRTAGRAVGLVKPDGDSAPLKQRIADVEEAQWRAFELADAMEQGLAMELTTGFVTPPREEEPAQRLKVTRSEDKEEHVLRSEGGEPLLVARSFEKGRRVDIYVPTGGDPPMAVGPAFSLSAEGKGDRWTLTCERCECCEYLPQARACCSGAGKRVLAHIRHSREEIGGGSAMCMEVDLPALQSDGTPAVWCTRSGGADQGSKLSLESRLPRWSKRLQSLALDFQGRATCTSAKNFQLQLPREKPCKEGDVELLFGKTAANTFVLDYKHPLGMAQAFGIALSTRDWQ